jgi:ornithine lipid hydroxylase
MPAFVTGESGRAKLVSWLIWPFVYVAGLIGSGMAIDSAHPLLWFNATYLSMALAVAVLERLLPYESRWLEDDGETASNLAHTLLNKGLVQLAAALITTFTMVTAMAIDTSSPARFWPTAWPLPCQVVLGLLVAELGLYVAHRLAHECAALWRFHALHHSVERLWVINTGRFHIVDTLLKVAFSQSPLYLLGAPLPVFLWISAVTAFTGLLTHCNIDVRTGVLDFVFNTPRLHRWHHSKRVEEGNRNYGENIMLWDLVFGTYFNPPRRPSPAIGIEGRIASGFLRQLIQPFTSRGVREILRSDATR